ncbi:yrdC domain-containing protein, mitochondrial [Megalops cyprinoides]|uniref:yrdC domain-containing protein, mitochondrial n=1 Tax=Megalops cyprinoides TaxID=118141 RepID=UPI0018654CDD|nr:yrdC domain-containing protein, mitochondrial [Megalops cyprinoides]
MSCRWFHHIWRPCAQVASKSSRLFMQALRCLCTSAISIAVCSSATRTLPESMCKELKTRVLRLAPHTANGPSLPRGDGQQDWRDVLETTVNSLKEGQVVAVPTDTIYGLACLAQNSDAVKRVYDIKGRNGQKPLAICVGEIDDIYKYCKVTVPQPLLTDLLPGPVTLVLERSDALNPELNPFTPLVGVRIPDHSFIRRLSQMCGEPLALTSANVSSHSSTIAVREFQDLWPKLAVVVDGGPIGDQSPECRLGSTVIDLSASGRYQVIRPGCALCATVDILEQKYKLSQAPADH